MKFTTSDNYRGYPIKIPDPWFETKLTDKNDIIYSHLRENYWVYDCDECGNEEIYFLFDDGSKFLVNFSWYWSYSYKEDEDEEDSYVVNAYDFEIVTDLPDFMTHKERDWINVASWGIH